MGGFLRWLSARRRPLSWDFLEDPLAEPQARRKLGHQAATVSHSSRDPEVCLNISRAEQAGSLSTVCRPCGRRGGEEIHFPLQVFSHGEGEGNKLLLEFQL